MSGPGATTTGAGDPRAHLDALFAAGYRNLPRPARFERIEGAEHMVMIDQPVRFMEVLNRFLRPR